MVGSPRRCWIIFNEDMDVFSPKSDVRTVFFEDQIVEAEVHYLYGLEFVRYDAGSYKFDFFKESGSWRHLSPLEVLAHQLD